MVCAQDFETFRWPVCNKRLPHTVLKWHVLDIFHHLFLIKDIRHLGSEWAPSVGHIMVGFLILFDGGSRVSSQNIIVSLVRMGQRKMSDMFISWRYSLILWTQSTFHVSFLYDPARHLLENLFRLIIRGEHKAPLHLSEGGYRLEWMLQWMNVRYCAKNAEL